MNLVKKIIVGTLFLAISIKAVDEKEIVKEQLDSAFKKLFLQDPLTVFSGKSPFSDKNSQEMQVWETVLNFVGEGTFSKRASMAVSTSFAQLKKINDQVIEAIPQALSSERALNTLKENREKLKPFLTNKDELLLDLTQKLLDGVNYFAESAYDLKKLIDNVSFSVNTTLFHNFTKKNPEPIKAKDFDNFIGETNKLLQSINRSDYSNDYVQLIAATKELVKDINTILLKNNNYPKELYKDLYYPNVEEFDYVYSQMTGKCKIVSAIDLRNNQRGYARGNPLEKLMDGFCKKLLQLCRSFLLTESGFGKVSYENIPDATMPTQTGGTKSAKEARINLRTKPREEINYHNISVFRQKYQEQSKQAQPTQEKIQYYNVEEAKEELSGAGPYHTTLYVGQPKRVPARREPRTREHHQSVSDALAQLGIAREPEPTGPEGKKEK